MPPYRGNAFLHLDALHNLQHAYAKCKLCTATCAVIGHRDFKFENNDCRISWKGTLRVCHGEMGVVAVVV